MENKNRFSILLEYLIGTAGLKNYILAQELQYDVSYISKWVTGKVIPAGANGKTGAGRQQQLPRSCRVREGLAQLCNNYQVDQLQDLKMAIYDNLEAEYNYARENWKDNTAPSKERVQFFPELSLEKYIEKMCHPVLRRVSSLDIIAAMDMMAMRRDYRTQIDQIPGSTPLPRSCFTPMYIFHCWPKLTSRTGTILMTPPF